MMDVPNGYGRTAMIVVMTPAMVGITISLEEKPSFRAWPKNGVHTIVLGWFWIFEICRLKGPMSLGKMR